MSEEEIAKSVGRRSSMSTAERLAYIESDVHYIKKDLVAIKTWVKWAAMTIGATALIAMTQFILKGGFFVVPGGTP